MRSLIIDGYNLAFAWNEVRPILLENSQKGREQLLQLLSRYKRATSQDLIVVFDGSGDNSHSRQQKAQGVRVIFSRLPKTADDEIRKLVQNFPHKGSLLLVTSDREVAGFAKRRNIAVTGSGAFAKQVEEVMRAQEKEEVKPETGNLDEWLKLFGNKGGKSWDNNKQ
jgi:predicted RNA-binding protein with PIN domain